MAESFMDRVNQIQRQSAGRAARRSTQWFQNKIKNVDSSMKKDRPDAGKMFFYQYDAKYAAELPYWDKLPLVIVLDYNAEYVLGMNLHYLPPNMRATFLNDLIEDHAVGMDEDRRFGVSYKALKKADNRYFRPTIHLYIRSRIKTPFIEVEPDEWPNAVALPVAKWSGATGSKVHADSRKVI